MRCSTAIHACTPGNHGNNQSKEKGRWNGQLYRPDPPQEKGVLVYQEAQTFARKQAAQAWAKRRETELAGHGAIERANRGGHAIKDMIDRYLVGAEKARPLGKTKRQTRLVCTTRYPAMRQDVRAQNPQEQLARKKRRSERQLAMRRAGGARSDNHQKPHDEHLKAPTEPNAMTVRSGSVSSPLARATIGHHRTVLLP